MLFSIALKRDGSLWGWGGNWTGQLGDGKAQQLQKFTTPLNKLPRLLRPERIGTDADWTAIAAGSEHVLALKDNGTLWAWGNNDCGQLGVGNFVSTNRPVRVGQDHDWVAFAAGGAGRFGAQSAAIKHDGSLWVWGNWQGRAIPSTSGGGTNTPSNSMSLPTRLGNATNWVRVVCGLNHGLAFKNDGTMWIWGIEVIPPGIGVTPRAPDAIAQIGLEKSWVGGTLGAHGLGGQEMLQGLTSDGTVWSWDQSVTPAVPMSGLLAPPASAPTTGLHAILGLGTAVPIAAKPTHEGSGSR
jgi:alpha-tubulin suppressor-like RCC1 family protein